MPIGELTNKNLIKLEAMQHLQEEKNKRSEKKFMQLAGVFSKINAAMSELEIVGPYF